MVINEFDGLVKNKIYEAATIYLANKLSPHIRRLKISKHEKEKKFNITMERNEEVMFAQSIYIMLLLVMVFVIIKVLDQTKSCIV